MKMRICLVSFLVVVMTLDLQAQNAVGAVSNQLADSMINITVELGKISKSVDSLNARFKVYFDKLGAGGTNTVNDKQQRIITGIQMLAAAEQRVSNLQNAQFDNVQKYNDTRSRLIQIDSDLRPRNIDRSVALEGTTETEELRESRRQKLQSEKATLTQLANQLQATISENNDILREAQALAAKLRRMYMPLIEREMTEQ